MKLPHRGFMGKIDLVGTCEGCLFWKNFGNAGECYRYPPTPSMGCADSAWPTTQAQDWCGEWKRKVVS